jgi:hypothetical protein
LETSTGLLKILVIDNCHKLTLPLVDALLKKDKLSLQILSHLDGYKNTLVDQQNLLDTELTSSQFDACDIVIFVDHMDAFSNESENINRLTSVANVVNICLEKNIEKLIYICGFSLIFGSHFDYTVTEKTIWESSAKIDMKSKFLNLSQQEVVRGINEGLNATIISCGINLTNDKKENHAQVIDLFQENQHFSIVHQDDIVSTINKVIYDSAAPEKLILVSNTLDQNKTLKKINYEHNWIYKIKKLFSSNVEEKKIISLDNSATKSYLNKPFLDLSQLI